MCNIVLAPNDSLVLEIINAKILKEKNREIYDTLNECVAFINFRNIEKNEPHAIIALSYA